MNTKFQNHDIQMVDTLTSQLFGIFFARFNWDDLIFTPGNNIFTTVKVTMIGKRIGHYIITHQIGAGGMGQVYKGYDAHLHRSVAIKIL